MRWRPSRVAAFAATSSAFFLASSDNAPAAPVDFGGHSYDFVLDDEISWTGARDASTAAGGTLAVIESSSEQAFIESLLVDQSAPSGSYWFGLEETSDGVFAPISGNSTFTNFATGEPNNGVGMPETVGAVYWTASQSESTFDRRGKWNDLPDDGYPLGPGQPPLPDLVRGGYLIEFAEPVGSPGGGNGGGGNGGGGNGGGGNGGGGDGGGGGPNPIPVPAAVYAFPAAAFIAYFASRRLRRAW